MNAMPREEAVRLCLEIRSENRNRWYSLSRWQCWGCVKFSKGYPEKMCFSSKEGFRGCNLVNNRHDRSRLGK